MAAYAATLQGLATLGMESCNGGKPKSLAPYAMQMYHILRACFFEKTRLHSSSVTTCQWDFCDSMALTSENLLEATVSG